MCRQWHLPETTVNHALVGNLAMLGIGGIFVVILSNYFGRLPVLVYFLSISLATACWCAAAQSFESFMAARILNGFFSTVAQAVSGVSITAIRLLESDNRPGRLDVHKRHVLFPRAPAKN